MNYMRRQSIHTSAPSGSSEGHFSRQPPAAKPMRQRVRAQRRSSIGGPSAIQGDLSCGSSDGGRTAARMRRRTTLDTLSSVLPSFLPAPTTCDEAAGCCPDGVDEIFQQAARVRDSTIKSVQEDGGYGMYKWREIQSKLASANIKTNLAAQMVISSIFEESSQSYHRNNLGGEASCKQDNAAVATRAHQRTSRRFSACGVLANDPEEDDTAATMPADAETNISCAAFCQRAATSTVKIREYRSSRYLLGHKGGGGGGKSPEQDDPSDQRHSDGLISIIVDGIRDDCARRSSANGSDDTDSYYHDDNATYRAPCESKERHCRDDGFAPNIKHRQARDLTHEPDHSIPAPMPSFGEARLHEALVRRGRMRHDVNRKQEQQQEEPPITIDGGKPGKDTDEGDGGSVDVDFPRRDDSDRSLFSDSAAVSASPDVPNKEGERGGLINTRVRGGMYHATDEVIDSALTPVSPDRDGNKCNTVEGVGTTTDENSTTVVQDLTSPVVKFPRAQRRRSIGASMYAPVTPVVVAPHDDNPPVTPLPPTKFRRAQRRHSMVGGGYSISSSMRPRHDVAQTTSSDTAGIIFKSGIDQHPSGGMDVMFIPPSWSSPTTEKVTLQPSPSGANGNNDRQTGIGTPKKAMGRRNSIGESGVSSINSGACASIIFSNFSASSSPSN